MQTATLADVSTENLWSLGKFIEHDRDFAAIAPEFRDWLLTALVAEHKRRMTEPEAPSAPLVIPAGTPHAKLADFLMGSTALSYASNQDQATQTLLDSLTLGIATLAANALRGIALSTYRQN